MSLKIDTIFLDMDGVCCDWVSGVLRLFGETRAPHILWAAHPGEYNLEKVLGISRNQLWRTIDREGSAFWEELAPYPWFNDLYTAASRLPHCMFLTSPSLSPLSSAGKVAWLQKHMGPNFRDYIITEKKHVCARPGALLIDDSTQKVQEFTARGGEAYLFRQPWNAGCWDPTSVILELKRRAYAGAYA